MSADDALRECARRIVSWRGQHGPEPCAVLDLCEKMLREVIVPAIGQSAPPEPQKGLLLGLNATQLRFLKWPGLALTPRLIIVTRVLGDGDGDGNDLVLGPLDWRIVKHPDGSVTMVVSPEMEAGARELWPEVPVENGGGR